MERNLSQESDATPFDPYLGRVQRMLTYVLLTGVYVVCELAALDGKISKVAIVSGVLLLVLATVLSYFGPQPRKGRKVPKWVFALFLVMFVAPLCLESFVREFTSEGYPLEMQLINGLRAIGILTAGLSRWSHLRRLAGVIALFLTLFSAVMATEVNISYALVGISLLGGVWLVLEHLNGEVEQTVTRTVSTSGEKIRLRVPYREAILFGVLLVGITGFVLAGPKRVMLSLGELVPTSGGTGNTDPFARYGVGDGPEEVAGDNAQAAGMVEANKMIEDNKDALIDAINDMYGPPHKTRKNDDRMIAAGVMDVIQNHGKLPENKRPNRDFETSRSGGKRDLKPESRSARAALEIEGRTPIHIRLVAYQNYDYETARWQVGRKPSNLPLEPIGNDWMQMTSYHEADWYSKEDEHKLKVAKLKENLVPTPAMFTHVRISKVDKPDYYDFDYDGVLILATRKKTPSGVVVQTKCRTLEPTRLQPEHFWTAPTSYGAIPPPLETEIKTISSEWIGHLPKSWEAVQEVLERLRRDYVHDPNAAPPKNHPNPVLWFLKESHRGPDYLFATAATLLLRSHGFSSRVAVGFYASREAYDPVTKHTPVRDSDIHVWSEVQLRDGHWLVIEPTPGFETLPPLKTWAERLEEGLFSVASWFGRNWLELLVVTIGGVTFLRLRLRVFDWIQTGWWNLNHSDEWRRDTLRAVRILERRACWSGYERKETQTWFDWIAKIPDATTHSRLQTMIRLAEWARYAPNLLPLQTPQEVREICQTTLQEWSLGRFFTLQKKPLHTELT